MPYRIITRLIIISLGFSLMAYADTNTTRPAPQATDAALQTARDYCKMMQSGEGVKAVEKYWNFDAMFDAIFGDDMKQVPDGDRAEMRKLMLGVIGRVYANPKVNDLLANATFDDFTTRELPDHRVVVDFNIRLASGKVLPNAFYWSQGSGGWRIVDAATNGKPMTEAIRNEYLRNPHGVTPVRYVRAMAGGH